MGLKAFFFFQAGADDAFLFGQFCTGFAKILASRSSWAYEQRHFFNQMKNTSNIA